LVSRSSDLKVQLMQAAEKKKGRDVGELELQVTKLMELKAE